MSQIIYRSGKTIRSERCGSSSRNRSSILCENHFKSVRTKSINLKPTAQKTTSQPNRAKQNIAPPPPPPPPAKQSLDQSNRCTNQIGGPIKSMDQSSPWTNQTDGPIKSIGDGAGSSAPSTTHHTKPQTTIKYRVHSPPPPPAKQSLDQSSG